MKNLIKNKFMYNNNFINKKTIIATIVLLFAFSFFSCYSPNPLYGKWSDNIGNKITFNPDLTYSAKIYDENNISYDFSGDYNVIDNTIMFSTESGDVIVTEWDIRGSIMYLTWTTSTGTVNISLYKTSK